MHDAEVDASECANAQTVLFLAREWRTRVASPLASGLEICISTASRCIKKIAWQVSDLLRDRFPSTPMELAVVFSSSSSANSNRDEPDFDFDFLDYFFCRMRHPAATDLFRGITELNVQIRSYQVVCDQLHLLVFIWEQEVVPSSFECFVVSFSLNNSAEEDSKKVQSFLKSMHATIKEHPLWAHAAEKEEDIANEGLEKYIMTKIFIHIFASSPEDKKMDLEISEKIHLLQHFIMPDDLGVHRNYTEDSSFLLAVKELQKINSFTAPREKLLCVLKCCSIINNILLQISMLKSQEMPGDKVFLSILTYATIKANPPQLHSNLKYIQLFRMNSKLVSEGGLNFTNLLNAKTFIASMDGTSLSMDEGIFEMSMQLARSCQVPMTDPRSVIHFCGSSDADFDQLQGFGT